jgi:hypothetical protein
LPSWAIPSGNASSGDDRATSQQRHDTDPGPVAHATKPDNSAGEQPTNGFPSTGRELFKWLRDQEQVLAEDSLVDPGELIDYVARTGVKAGHGPRIVNWTPQAVALGKVEALAFIANRKSEPVQPAEHKKNGTRTVVV